MIVLSARGLPILGTIGMLIYQLSAIPGVP